MWFIVGCIFSIFTISGLYSQSYKVRLNNAYNEQNFFRAEKSIELKKPSNDEYLSNQFYVKSGDNFSIPEIEKNIKIILSNSGYSNIIINKIEKPFQKYINSEMLKKQSSRLENIFKITIENDYEIFDLCSLLSDNYGIIYATPVINYRFADFIPNDNHIDKLWWLENSDFFKSWDIAKGDKTITIGIIDSGCDYLHEDLNSQVKINTLEIPDDNIDNDGNGFIDDTHGWDFVGDISHFDAITGKFIEDNNVIPKYQSNDHGTHVTGIAAAKTNNTTGISSSGFDVMFLPVKIGVDDLSKSRLVYRPYEALLYAAMMGVDIINCSWASSFHDPLAVDVINEVLNKGVVIVAASGNETFWIDNFPYYPAALPGVIAVGSINQNNTRSLFSNYGVRVSCYAPGEGIYSTLNNNRYGNKSGTSMASPLVAGFIASVKKAFPHFTNQQILQQIRSTTSQMLPQSILLHGKLNAFDAVRYNNINFQSFVSPGISFEDVLIENSNVVDKIGTTKIRVKLKNHLSDASNIVVTFSPQDNFFDISRNNFQINSFPSNTSQSLEFDLNLSENCPWFDGNLLFVAEYKADDYYNVELIEIPVKLETSNKSLLVQSFDDNLDIDWYSSDVADKFDFWSVGYDNTNKRGVVYNFGKLNNLFSPSKDTVIDVSAIDSRNLFIAVNGKDGYNAILKSENSGASFTSNSISDLLSSIDNIYFYDLTNGILTGRNEQNIAEILYTENGLNYKKSSVNYTFSNIENEYISTNINARKSNLFVATSYGRILKSMDKGKNWSKISDWFNDKITDIAAINDDSIFVIVNLNSENKLQFSTNGGARFSNIPAVNIDLNNIIKMFVPDSSNTLYLLSKEGKLNKTTY
jgi:subtilisin family serine protease